MKSVLKSAGLVLVLGAWAMADLPVGTFTFDMKPTLKANGKADEQMTYLLKNMSKDIQTITVSKGQKVTLTGVNRKGKARKHTFACQQKSKNACEIAAGRGMLITALDAKHIKLDMPMQNGEKLHILFRLRK